VRLDRDVVRTKQDDLRNVAVFLNIENDFGFDNPRVVQMQPFDFSLGVLAQRLGDALVPDCDCDQRIRVCSLHGFGSVCGFMDDRFIGHIRYEDEPDFPIWP